MHCETGHSKAKFIQVDFWNILQQIGPVINYRKQPLKWQYLSSWHISIYSKNHNLKSFPSQNGIVMGHFWENTLLLKKPICSYRSSADLQYLLLISALLFCIRGFEVICSQNKILRDTEFIIIFFLDFQDKMWYLAPISYFFPSENQTLIFKRCFNFI